MTANTTTAGSDKSQLFHSRLKSNPVWRSNLSHSSKNESGQLDNQNPTVTNSSSYIPLKLNERKPWKQFSNLKETITAMNNEEKAMENPGKYFKNTPNKSGKEEQDAACYTDNKPEKLKTTEPQIITCEDTLMNQIQKSKLKVRLINSSKK